MFFHSIIFSHDINLSGNAYTPCLKVHNIWRERLQDIPAYASLEIDCKQVRTCIEIALDCMQEDPCKRPKLNELTCRLSNVENKDNDSEVRPLFLTHVQGPK